MSTADQYIDPIREYIVDHHLDGQSDLRPETPLLEWGVIDSFALTDVLEFIEDEFEVTVPADDITLENLRDLEAIGALVARLGERGPGAPRVIEPRDNAAARVCGGGDRERYEDRGSAEHRRPISSHDAGDNQPGNRQGDEALGIVALGAQRAPPIEVAKPRLGQPFAQAAQNERPPSDPRHRNEVAHARGGRKWIRPGPWTRSRRRPTSVSSQVMSVSPVAESGREASGGGELASPEGHVGADRIADRPGVLAMPRVGAADEPRQPSGSQRRPPPHWGTTSPPAPIRSSEASNCSISRSSHSGSTTASSSTNATTSELAPRRPLFLLDEMPRDSLRNSVTAAGSHPATLASRSGFWSTTMKISSGTRLPSSRDRTHARRMSSRSRLAAHTTTAADIRSLIRPAGTRGADRLRPLGAPPPTVEPRGYEHASENGRDRVRKQIGERVYVALGVIGSERAVRPPFDELPHRAEGEHAHPGDDAGPDIRKRARWRPPAERWRSPLPGAGTRWAR